MAQHVALEQNLDQVAEENLLKEKIRTIRQGPLGELFDRLVRSIPKSTSFTEEEESFGGWSFAELRALRILETMQRSGVVNKNGEILDPSIEKALGNKGIPLQLVMGTFDESAQYLQELCAKINERAGFNNAALEGIDWGHLYHKFIYATNTGEEEKITLGDVDCFTNPEAKGEKPQRRIIKVVAFPLTDKAGKKRWLLIPDPQKFVQERMREGKVQSTLKATRRATGSTLET